MSNVYLYITDQVHLLDISGVTQVFQEAQQLGFDYNLKFISDRTAIKSSSRVELSALIDFSKISPKVNDNVVIPGFDMQNPIDYSRHCLFLNWLKNANVVQTG